jgi:hypothetical protein
VTGATYFHREFSHPEHCSAQIVEHTRFIHRRLNQRHEAISFSLVYGMLLHPELMTYCSFERCAASTRAIPPARFFARLNTQPVLPLVWTKNQSGMQGGAEIVDREPLDATVLEMAQSVVAGCQKLAEGGAHKQHLNRYMMPWLTISTVLTVSKQGLGHMFAQRRHRAAQPEFQRLAQLMLEAMQNSKPRDIDPRFTEHMEHDFVSGSVLGPHMTDDARRGFWMPPTAEDIHAPFVPLDQRRDRIQTIVQSVARCARVSYEKHDATGERTGKLSTLEEDIERFQGLLLPENDPDEPKHMTPAGHVLVPTASPHHLSHGKFAGYLQFRKLCRQETSEFDWAAHGIEP